ncbi:MAG: PAS domain S-box protein, partial [Methylococcaceae bacterium]|nr:PAS domain S-box protein [Methylococcaceae bacterium]
MAYFGIGFLSLLLIFCIRASIGAPQAGAAADAAIGPTAGGDVSLTPEERQWLSGHDGQIRIGITVIPPQVLRGNDGYQGLAIDYIRLMEDKLGCRFKLVPYTTWNEVIEAAKTHEIDMIFAAQQTPERLTYLVFTQPYIELPNMILVRKDREGGASLEEIRGWRVAVSEGSAVHEYLKKDFAYLALMPVPAELSGLMKVSMGETDAMVIEISRASYYIEKAGILNLRVAGSAGLLYQLRFAVRSDWPILRGILDKGLAAVTNDERRTISQRWIIVGQEGIFASKTFRVWFASGLALITLTIVAIVVWNRTLRRIVEQRTSQLRLELAERGKIQALISGQKQILELVAMDAPLPQSLTALIQLVETQIPNILGSIQLMESDGVYLHHFVAPNLPAEYIAAIDAVAIGPKAGSCGTAAFRKTAVYVEDIATDPLWESYKAIALSHGLRACWSAPIFDAKSQIVGTFAMYSPLPGLPAPEHLRLIDLVTHTAAIAIASHRIEFALRESEQRYRLVFENSPVSIWEEDFSSVKALFDDLKKAGVTDIEVYFDRHPETIRRCAEQVGITDVNQAALALHGAESKEALFAGLINTFTPASFLTFRQELVCLWNGETCMQSDATVKTLAGEQRDVAVHFSVCAGYEESFSKVLVSLIDITERKQAELSVALLSFALNNVHEAAFLIDENARFHFVNEEACRILGYSREELLERGVEDVDPDWPKARWPDHWRELKRTGSLIFEGRHQTKDGRMIPVEISANFIEYAQRDYNLALVRDITERKRAEKELADAHLLFQGVIEQSPIPMVIVKPTGEITFNQACAEHLNVYDEPSFAQGIKLQEMDQPWQDYDTRGNLVSTRELPLAKSLRGESTKNLELRVVRKNGSERWEMVNGAPIYNNAGELIAGFVAFQDITERKRVEEELRLHKDQLEETVQQRTAELLLARDAADAANKAKSAFLANMSHELRTPLNAILGFSSMMRRDPLLTESQTENLNIINRSGEHLLSLINDVLEMAKIEAGHLQLEITAFDLDALVREVTEMMQIRAKEKGLQLLLNQSSESPPYIRSDEARIRQILIN